MRTTTPPNPQQPPEPKQVKEGSVKHVVRTGLPPGIDIDDVKDPGAKAPPGPADNRS